VVSFLLKITATSILAVAAATTVAMPAQAAANDSDRDGMSNSWEIKHRLNPRNKADARQDPTSTATGVTTRLRSRSPLAVVWQLFGHAALPDRRDRAV
jgi:hypothetical protein